MHSLFSKYCQIWETIQLHQCHMLPYLHTLSIRNLLSPYWNFDRYAGNQANSRLFFDFFSGHEVARHPITPRHLILHSIIFYLIGSLLFLLHGHNFVKFILTLLKHLDLLWPTHFLFFLRTAERCGVYVASLFSSKAMIFTAHTICSLWSLVLPIASGLSSSQTASPSNTPAKPGTIHIDWVFIVHTLDNRLSVRSKFTIYDMGNHLSWSVGSWYTLCTPGGLLQVKLCWCHWSP